jgi:hypothetical protein
MTAPRKPVADRTLEEHTDFNIAVAPRTDREHSKWSQHAVSRGFLYKLLRRIEYLASRNDGFAHERAVETARKIGCDRWTLWYLKRLLREAGIISADRWGTNTYGHRVRGFDLAPHADYCKELDGHFVSILEHSLAAQRLRFQPACPTAVQQPSNTRPTPVQHHFAPKPTSDPTSRPTSCPTSAPGQVDVGEENGESELFGGIAVGVAAGKPCGFGESLESCQSLESFESSSLGCSASAKGTEDQDPTQHPFADLTMTSKPPGKENHNEIRTVGQYFTIDHLEVESVLSALSGGLFDPKYLAKYEHKHELKRACVYAVDWFSGEPFVGWTTRAKILGNVMDRLKDDGIDAPRYFPRMLREMRAEARAA